LSVKKSERLATLEELLRQNPSGLRKAEIARKLGVHRSTAGRYITELSDTVPIWEQDFRIGILSEKDTLSVSLKDQERGLVIVGLINLLMTSNGAHDSLRGLLTKLHYKTLPQHVVDDINRLLNTSPSNGFSHSLNALVLAWLEGTPVGVELGKSNCVKPIAFIPQKILISPRRDRSLWIEGICTCCTGNFAFYFDEHSRIREEVEGEQCCSSVDEGGCDFRPLDDGFFKNDQYRQQGGPFPLLKEEEDKWKVGVRT